MQVPADSDNLWGMLGLGSFRASATCAFALVRSKTTKSICSLVWIGERSLGKRFVRCLPFTLFWSGEASAVSRTGPRGFAGSCNLLLADCVVDTFGLDGDLDADQAKPLLLDGFCQKWECTATVSLCPAQLGRCPAG